jgi:hypothetical protein
MSPSLRPCNVIKPEENKAQSLEDDYKSGDEDFDDIDEIVENSNPYNLEHAKSVLNFPVLPSQNDSG